MTTPVSNVALSDTFNTWRLRFNTVANFISTSAANTGESVANSYLTSTYVANTTFQSALANTNAYVQTMLSVANAEARYSNTAQLANTNSYINSNLANTNSWIQSNLANTNSWIQSNLANTNLAIADRIQVANLNSTLGSYTTNTYASNTFSSYDTIVVQTPEANTEYEFLRALPRNQDYRTIYYSSQFGSANVGFWVGSTLVANVTANTTNQTSSVSVTGKTGDRVFLHFRDSAIANTCANVEFNFGG